MNIHVGGEFRVLQSKVYCNFNELIGNFLINNEENTLKTNSKLFSTTTPQTFQEMLQLLFFLKKKKKISDGNCLNFARNICFVFVWCCCWYVRASV